MSVTSDKLYDRNYGKAKAVMRQMKVAPLFWEDLWHDYLLSSLSRNESMTLSLPALRRFIRRWKGGE